MDVLRYVNELSNKSVKVVKLNLVNISLRQPLYISIPRIRTGIRDFVY